MILTVYGTTGELIKLAPLLARLRDRGHGYLSATTGQQVSQIPVFLDAFELPPPDLWLARGAGGRDLRSSRDIPAWAATVTAAFLRRSLGLRRELRRGPGRPLVLVAALATAVALVRRRSRAEVVAFGLLAPVYALAHGFGMWRGAFLAVGGRR